MGIRGPKPLPSAIKQARGTFRADRAAANEPIAAGKPVCPQWLGDDAKREFRRVMKWLAEMGVTGRVDANALTRYSVLWVRWRSAEQMIAKTGEVFPLKDENGKLKYLQQSPYVAIARSLSEQLGRLEDSFGMNPSSRSRLNVTTSAVNPTENSKARFFGK